MKTCKATTPAEWRRWLATHHATASALWLVCYKRHTGRPSLAYEDAVNEALRYGWIDSLVKRLDDRRYARKFTPRRPDSVWSAANRGRYARLAAAGRLTRAGVRRAPGVPAPGPSIDPNPRYIRAALLRHPAAQRRFDGLPPSHRRRYVEWIDSARRVETRIRRLNQAIHRLEVDGKPGLR